MIRVKICGITSPEDARAAVAAGADAIGLIFYEKSPRAVTPEQAANIRAVLPPFVSAVGVFVNESPYRIGEIQRQVGLHYAQFSGEETPEDVALLGRSALKAIRPTAERDLEQIGRFPTAGALLLDTPQAGVYGGTGRTGDWSLSRKAAQEARRAGMEVLLAGGLTPENVAEAVRAVRPYGVDVSSGVEKAPGRKDHGKVASFVKAAIEAGLRD